MSDENTPAEAAEPVEAEETQETQTEAKEPESQEAATNGTKPEKAADAKASPSKPSPPPRYKFRVLNEDKELSHEEAQELLNKGHYFDRARKEMEDARYVLRQFTDKPLESWIELYQGKTGSREKAIEEVRKVVEAWLGTEMEFEHATPEKKRQLELERELAALKARDEENNSRAKKAQEETSWNAFTDTVVKEFETSGVAFDDEAIDDLFSVWNAAIDLEEEITPAEAVRRANARIERRTERNLEKLSKDPDKLKAKAPDLLKQLRSEDIAKAKAARQSPRQPTGPSEPAPRDSGKRRVMSMSEMRHEMSQALKG